jgi:hypothetical protein
MGKKLGIVKNFIDELAKHKMLVYFVTLWGAMLFLWTVYGIIEYGFNTSDILGIIDIFFHLSELFAGALLALFGIKLINANFLETIKNEKILIYFLLLWAASFFFLGIYDIVDHGPWIFEYPNCIIAFLSGLAALFAGIVLGLFSWNALNETE